MSQTTITSQQLPETTAGGDGVLRNRTVLTSVLLLLAVYACRDAWMDIARIVSKDEEASHILLVPLVFARIAWVRRAELKGIKMNASLWGAAIALVGVGLWFFGNIKAMQVVWHFGAIVTLFGAFVCVNGLQIVRRLWPAFLVLVFLMPLPGVIRHPLALFLQNASAQATEIVIVALGFELVRNGNLLIINDYPVGVAEACNGMRMVSMLILVVFAFVFSEKIRPWVQVALVLIAAPMAILLNIVRLVPTVLAFGFFSEDFAYQLHDWLGWVMVLASYFVLMGILVLMRWLMLPIEPEQKLSRPRPFKKRWLLWPKRFSAPTSSPGPQWQRPVSIVSVMVVLGLAYAIGQSLPDGSETDGYHERVRLVANELPRRIGGWTSVDKELPEAAVALLRPNVLISRRFEERSTGRSFAFLIVQCADARDMEGHYPPNCYPSSGWTGRGREQIDLQLGQIKAVSMDYRFDRVLQDGVESIGVVNLIVVPEDGFTTSMRGIRRLGGTVMDRYYGAAQVQFVFDGRWGQDERLAAVEQIGVILEPLIRVILDKTGKETELSADSEAYASRCFVSNKP
ncbi:MAG: exosortase/archaeosortase family protein [Planctomycetota bacterium]